MDQKKVDAVIVGAGPVGLFAAFSCGMLGMKSLIIDALDQPGGQCAALYPEKPIYDIPGIPQVLAGDLIHQLLNQIAPFSPEFALTQQVVGLSQDTSSPSGSPHDWIVSTSSSHSYKGRVVVFSTGGGRFRPKRPALPRLEEFESTSVFYHVSRVDALKDKRVVIAGGGDSAIDWALLLAEKGTHVTLVHRRLQFRAQEASLHQFQQAVEAEKIQFLAPRQLVDLEGQDGCLTHVILDDFKGGLQYVDADALLPFYGLETEKSAFKDWGLETENDRLKIDPTTGETNQPGIYAAGDCAAYAHKLKLIMTGFSETAQIAHHAKQNYFPESVYRFQHSTSVGVPQKN